MYCVLNMGWTPSQYIELNRKERAFVIASIMIKIEAEKKEQAKMKSQQAMAKSKIRRR